MGPYKMARNMFDSEWMVVYRGNGSLLGESLCTELERDTGAGSDYTFWGYRLSDRMAMYGMVCLETVIA